MSTRSLRRFTLTLAVTLTVALAAAQPAQAHGFLGYGLGFRYAPFYGPSAAPSLLVLNNQYFDFSVSGLEDLCKSQPGVCNATQLESLESLQRYRAAGWALEIIGVGVMLGGPLVEYG